MTPSLFPTRRVVVTGMGAMSPLGTTLKQSWERLLGNQIPGTTTLEEALRWQHLPEEQLERELQASKALPCQVAAPVMCNDSHLKHDTRTPRFVQMALQAGKEALMHSKLLLHYNSDKEEEEEKNELNLLVPNLERVGVCIGSGMSSVREITEAARTVETRGLRRLSPHFVPKVLSNSAAGRLSLEYGFQGPNHSVSTACAAGTHALGDAMRCIQYNNADIVLAGGAESCIDPLSIAGFCRLKALSTTHPPQEASRPFDKDRDGFVMAEGSAILVLEELEHAKARNAPIMAEVCGYGLTGDAYHITAPDPDGKGASRAMRMALEQATITCQAYNIEEMIDNIDYVNAHATSTPMGDEIEAQCIDRLFARTSGSPTLRVSSTKGATGHLLGAAGALEAAFTVMALETQRAPPNSNLVEVEIPFEHPGVQMVNNNGEEGILRLNYAMSNSFGFGGTNASIVFRRYDG